MSKKTEEFERKIETLANTHKGERLPAILPAWLIAEGVKPGARIIRAERIGNKDRRNKTDVIIYLEDSEPIKISVKMNTADNFGNWYSHERFIIEFGETTFRRMTEEATEFANDWAKTAKALYVGVSICFGRRTGRTGLNFTNIFSSEDIATVARGFGDGIAVANCLYISDSCAKDMDELICRIKPITADAVNLATDGLKTILRPVNPMTEKSNRSKNVYTRFQPFESLASPTVITTPDELFRLGRFVTVEPTGMTHNRVLNELETEYGIIIPRK